MILKGKEFQYNWDETINIIKLQMITNQRKLFVYFLIGPISLNLQSD